MLKLPWHLLASSVFPFLALKDIFWLDAVVERTITLEQMPHQLSETCNVAQVLRWINLQQRFYHALRKTTLQAEVPLTGAASAFLLSRGIHAENITLRWTSRGCHELHKYILQYGAKARSAKLTNRSDLSSDDLFSIFRAIGSDDLKVSALATEGCNARLLTSLHPLVNKLVKLSGIKMKDNSTSENVYIAAALIGAVVKVEVLISCNMSTELLIIIARTCPLLKEITVSNAVVVDDLVLEELALRCPALESVKLYDCEVSDSGVLAFCRIWSDRTAPSSMHTLHIESSRLMLSREVVDAVARAFTKLQHLSMGKAYPFQSMRSSEWAAWEESLTDLALKCPSLRTLRLNWETLKVLVAGGEPLMRLFAIESLTVDGFLAGMNAPGAFRQFADGLAGGLLGSLCHLTMYAPPGDQGDTFLSALTQAQCALHTRPSDRQLESVHFSGCYQLTDASAVALIDAHPRLHTVRLEDADQLTNAVLAAVSRLGPVAQVVSFPGSSKMGSEAGDSGVARLARRCPNLTELDLSCSPHVLDTSIHALAVHCPRLQTCAVKSAVLLTFSALLDLCRSCRSLQALQVNMKCVQTDANMRSLQDLYDVSRLAVIVAD
jgi:hypothetical protein